MNKPSKKISGKLTAVTVLSLVLAILVGVTVWLEVRREPTDHKLQRPETTPITTPELTTPEKTTPEHTTPEQTTLQQQTTPLSTTPEQTTIPQTTPGQTTPPPTTLAQTTPSPTSVPLATTTTPEPTYPDVAVKTPYATLYYPGQYKDYVKTEVMDDGFETTVLFYCIAGEHKDALLFTIFFGGAEGEPLGSYQTSQGYAVDVTTEMSGYIPDGSWSSADADIFYAMQEGMNHVISRLESTPGFTPVQP